MRTVALTSVITQARQRADQLRGDINSANQFVTPSELIGYINSSWTELYDMLVSAYGDDYFLQWYTFSTNTTTDEYPLPDDFYKLMGVDALFGNVFYPLRKYQWAERAKFNAFNINLVAVYPYNVEYRMVGNLLHLIPLPNLQLTCRLSYVPRPWTQNQIAITAVSTSTGTITCPSHGFISNQLVRPTATGAGTPAVPSPLRNDTDYYVIVVDQDSIKLSTARSTDLASATPITLTTAGSGTLAFDTVIDGIAGWEDFVIVDAAIKMMQKEETDSAQLERQKGALGQRIASLRFNRDQGTPNQITDVDRLNNPFLTPGKMF